MKPKRFILSTVSMLFLATAIWATAFNEIRGLVLDPNGDPVKGAKVILRTLSSDYSRTEKTNDDGEFVFAGVAIGEYVVSVEAEGFTKAEQPVIIVSGSSPQLRFRLALFSVKENVNVEAKPGLMGSETPTPTTLVSKEKIEQTTGAGRSNSTKAITSYVPGSYMVHNQLHVHGGHQVTWLVDGVPIPSTNIGVDIGTPFNLNDITYLEAQRGSYSVQYGDRTYGIFSLVPRTGFEKTREGELSLIYGNFNLTDNFFSLADHTDRLAYYASLHGFRSDYGLATPTPEVLHDDARGYGGFGSLIFNTDQNNQFRFMTSFERDYFQVPNDLEAHAAGIRDEVRQRDWFAFMTWVHTARPNLLLTVTPFYHFVSGGFFGGPNDKPVIPRHEQTSHYAGAHIVVSAVLRQHSIKAGLYAFAQRDNNFFGIQSTETSHTSLNQRVKINGNLEALFIGDQYKPFRWLGFTGGMRLTHFGGVISENAADPRIGATIRLPRINWVLHGFYGRYYQAPPLSTVSGPLLEFVADAGFGFLPLRGERDEEHQFGVTVPVKGWWIDTVHYRTGAKNFLDKVALGSSNIFLPLTIERARIRGIDVSVTSPRIFNRVSASLVYALMRIEGQGPVTGGLTDFSPPSSDYFFLDHDQRHTLTAGFALRLPWSTAIYGEARYGSGFTDAGESDHHDGDEDDDHHEGTIVPAHIVPAHIVIPARNEHLPGHFRFDLSLEKRFGKTWSLSVNSWNVANSRYLLDNSPSLGGVHWETPRQIWVELRYRFRY
jgi:hypothetical protein